MRASITAIVLGLVLAAVSCGSDDSGAGNQDQFISQLCAEYSTCCQAAGRPSDGAQCRAFYGAFAPASGYDQAAANACLSEIRAQGGDKCDSLSRSTPSCERVFASSGTAKPGEACEDDTDCAPSDEGEVDCVSDFVNNATVQQCQLRLVGTDGSTPCVGTVDGSITFSSGGSDDGIPTKGYLCDIADGLSCDSQTDACKALGAVGATCSGGLYACVPAAYCDFAESVCKERLAVGAACQDDDDCQKSGYCEPTEKTCAARSALGQTCATNSECVTDNCTNQECGPADDFALTFICGSN